MLPVDYICTFLAFIDSKRASSTSISCEYLERPSAVPALGNEQKNDSFFGGIVDVQATHQARGLKMKCFLSSDPDQQLENIQAMSL